MQNKMSNTAVSNIIAYSARVESVYMTQGGIFPCFLHISIFENINYRAISYN
jgi:hypothetical protein